MEIKTEDGIREIICKEPKGKHTKEGFKLFTSLLDETVDAKKVNEYMDFLDKITSELTDLSIEQLDNLSSTEKDKLISFYQDKIVQKVDFLKSSLKLESSEPKTSQK